MIDYQRYRAILCLNGDLPEAEFFASFSLPIIAADGAANSLMERGIKPHWVVGDLDSINSVNRETLLCFHDPDQDTCDFQKTLKFLEEKNLLPVMVVGVNGGCLDHILKNVGLLAGSDNIFIAPPILGFSLTAGKRDCFSFPLKTKISIMGLPQAVVSSEGLKWELDHYVMQFPGKNSFYNETAAETIRLSILEGTALVLVYL